MGIEIVLSKLRYFWAKQVTPMSEVDELCEIIETYGLNKAKTTIAVMRSEGVISRTKYNNYVNLLDSVKGDEL